MYQDLSNVQNNDSIFDPAMSFTNGSSLTWDTGYVSSHMYVGIVHMIPCHFAYSNNACQFVHFVVFS